MAIDTIEFDKIVPPLNEDNWLLESTEKIEFINGGMWTRLTARHWFYPEVEKSKQFVKTGFYTDTDHPNEIVRVAGVAPEIWILLFKRR